MSSRRRCGKIWVSHITSNWPQSQNIPLKEVCSMAKVACSICGKPCGVFKYKYVDGVVCSACFKKAYALVPKMYNNVAEFRKVLEHDFSGMTTEARIDFGKKVEAEIKANKSNTDAPAIGINGGFKSTTTTNPAVNVSDNVVRCPKCGSTSISADKKGFGVGKAVVGAAIAGPIGLVGGNIGAKKVRVTCLNCGHQWIAGKAK